MKVTTDKPRVCVGGFVFRKGRERVVSELTPAMVAAGVRPVVEAKKKAPEPVAAPTIAQSYDDFTVAELREMANKKGVPGYYRMSKSELIEALSES